MHLLEMALEHPSARCRRGPGGAEFNYKKVSGYSSIGPSTNGMIRGHDLGAVAAVRTVVEVAALAARPLALCRLGYGSSGRLEKLLREHFRGQISARKTSRRSNQGLAYQAGTHTNSSQPRGPVPEALRGHREARQISIPSEGIGEGKGLIHKS